MQQWFPGTKINGVTNHYGPGGEYASVPTPNATPDGYKVVKAHEGVLTLVSPGDWIARDGKGGLTVIPHEHIIERRGTVYMAGNAVV